MDVSGDGWCLMARWCGGGRSGRVRLNAAGLSLPILKYLLYGSDAVIQKGPAAAGFRRTTKAGGKNLLDCIQCMNVLLLGLARMIFTNGFHVLTVGFVIE